MQNRLHRHMLIVICVASLLLSSETTAAPPTQEQVDIYSSLCSIGKIDKLNVDLQLGVIGRHLMEGGGKLSNEEFKNQFPDIRDEANRLRALQSYQDCLYKYVEKFHFSSSDGKAKISNSSFSPSVPQEKKRELIFLANELENFKNEMDIIKTTVPERYYDKRNSQEKYPRNDPRLLGIENYSRYKAFQTSSGIPNFSSLSNNDIVVLCDIYNSEAKSYLDFWRDYHKLFDLQRYTISSEVNRICNAAKRGR